MHWQKKLDTFFFTISKHRIKVKTKKGKTTARNFKTRQKSILFVNFNFLKHFVPIFTRVESTCNGWMALQVYVFKCKQYVYTAIKFSDAPEIDPIIQLQFHKTLGPNFYKSGVNMQWMDGLCISYIFKCKQNFSAIRTTMIKSSDVSEINPIKSIAIL